jgi:hypothetical protein
MNRHAKRYVSRKAHEEVVALALEGLKVVGFCDKTLTVLERQRDRALLAVASLLGAWCGALVGLLR